MIPNTFEYTRASSIDEAIELLQNDNTKVLSGGHSLIPAMKLRLDQPAKLVDISKLDELNFIKLDGNNLNIGAGVTHDRISKSAEVREHAQVLADAASQIGDLQVRNKGTIGGSLAHADPASDYPAVVLAYGGNILVKGPGGSRNIAADDFFQGLFMTALQPGEIITEITLPVNQGFTGGAYLKFPQPASRFALVGCAALIKMEGNTCTSARIALNGVSDCAFRVTEVEEALTGNEIDSSKIESISTADLDGIEVMSDHFASEKYRKHLAGVYIGRALRVAMRI